jgi:putative sugar O-methyltransferase
MKACKTLFEKLHQQSACYQPGIFWQEASKDMVEDLTQHGFQAFRRLATSKIFFVPSYGHPGNSIPLDVMNGLRDWIAQQDLNAKQTATLANYLSGFNAALADYRVLQASEYRTHQPDLLAFSESQIGEPAEQFEIEHKRYSRSALNYLLGLAFLKKHLDLTRLQTIMEIGGGYGTLGEIVYRLLPNARYIDIDIPPTLCCSHYYLNELVGAEHLTHALDFDDNQTIAIDGLKKLSTLASWQIAQLEGEIDLFVNFISFQEMEPDIVQNYLNQVNRLQAKWVLLRNMREGKPLKTQRRFGVDKPIFSEDYALMLPNYDLVETNVMPYGLKTVDGFHSEILLFKRK